MNREVNSVAHGLAGLGIRKGDLVGLLLPNCAEYVVVWFALAKLGAVEVAICDVYKGAFLEHPINLAKVRIIVTTSSLLPTLSEIEDNIPTVEIAIVIDTGDAVRPSAHFRRIATSTFEAVRSGNETNPGVEVSPRDLGAVLLTSGTTGPSKGVMMPHSQLYFFAEEDIQITGLIKRLEERKIHVRLTDAARELLAREGYDPTYGARPLKRVIQRELQNPLAQMILAGTVRDGDTVVATASPLGLFIEPPEHGNDSEARRAAE